MTDCTASSLSIGRISHYHCPLDIPLSELLMIIIHVFFFSLSQHTFGNAEATSTSFFFLQLIIRNSPINLSVRLTFGVSMISVMRRLVTLESELFEFFFFFQC